MMKYLKYETAKNDPLYKTLVEAAERILSTLGAFSKDEALKVAGYGVFDDDVFRWDYVKRMIEDNNNTELIPLASRFFRPTKKDSATFPPAQFPGRYIAHGYGKKTAGFCIADQRNGHFFITQLELKREMTKGKAKAHDKLLRIGRREQITTASRKVLLGPNIP